MKKRIIVFVCVVAIMIVALLTVSGFMTANDVFIGEFTQSSEELCADVGILSSIGYTRGCSVKTDNGVMYLKFYLTFGGINSSLGAVKSIKLDISEASEIRIYRNGKYLPVLQRNADGEFERIN